MKIAPLACVLIWIVTSSLAVSKPHIVVFGKWTSVKWQPNDDSPAVDLKMRALYVDGKVKEFTIGVAHDLTDRTFVVQRVFRLNDSLPEEPGPPRWRWQKGGWIIVDRVSGKVQQLNAPEFDPDHSQVSWFRDYAAYCGSSDDGQKTYVLVVQLGHRRPLLKKLIGEGDHASCPAPGWQRDPARVSFVTKDDARLTFSVSSRFADLVTEDDSEE